MVKTVFLTGGSSGIGQAIIYELKADDWKIVAPTHTELDLADLGAIAEYTASPDFIAEDIHAFVHTAAIWHDQDVALSNMPLAGFSPEQIIQTMNVGITSAMLLTRALLSKGLLTHFIGISGTFEDGAKGWLPYYTSKRALEDFVIGLAQDNPRLSAYGISPSDTATAAYTRFFPEYAESAQSPESVAKLTSALLSLSDGSDYKNGEVIAVRDGVRESGFHS
jgi:NAD(P)-dependent dehydrogenase (short-subunit alcohol dehydrogenase family)